MSWIKDGQRVNASYLGTKPLPGIIVESRVRYGGKVCYTVVLDEPYVFPWHQNEPTIIVIVDQSEISEIV